VTAAPIRARNGEVELEAAVRGELESGVPLLLICGLAQQLIMWPRRLLMMLGRRGYAVITFDNRDVGLSTHLHGRRSDLLSISNGTAPPPYRLSDMAADACAVLDAVGVESAHVLGVSMGGMIAQQMAIDAPTRVRSLISVMSTTGDRSVGRPEPGMLSLLMADPGATREEYAKHQLALSRAIGSRVHLQDEAEIRVAAGRAFDRAYDPRGVGRQFGAIQGSGDRTAALRLLEIPTLVIHGFQDPLVTPSGGEATAAAIPGARLLLVEEMGHDVPEPLWPSIFDAVEELTTAADIARG
jgi:pimeloyl-ACP methyl ester carboxylesterase